jgi:hypothetical protein
LKNQQNDFLSFSLITRYNRLPHYPKAWLKIFCITLVVMS